VVGKPRLGFRIPLDLGKRRDLMQEIAESSLELGAVQVPGQAGCFDVGTGCPAELGDERIRTDYPK
jgi:hypothetical protein